MMKLDEIDFEVNPEGICISRNDVQILDYLADKHGKSMLKELEVRKENTGVAMFFDDEEYKDLVVVLRLKSFKLQDDNGFIMFVVYNLHTSPEKLKALKAILQNVFTDSDLENSVTQTADKFAIKSIESNA